MRPGELHVVDFGPPAGHLRAGRRPAVVVHAPRYRAPGLGIVVPVTTTDRGLPHHISLPTGTTGLRRPCFAMTEQIRTIDTDTTKGRIGELPVDVFARVLVAVHRFIASP